MILMLILTMSMLSKSNHFQELGTEEGEATYWRKQVFANFWKNIITNS